MLTHLRELVADAKRRHYGLGAFNVENLETTLGVVRAAVLKRSPVVLQVSENTLHYGGLRPITAIVETIARDAAGDVPVALHLDHGRSFRTVAECIAAGFSSIMIDNSDTPYRENVILTKQAVDYAHRKDVWVQSELGQVKGLEEMTPEQREKYMTSPDEAKKFIDETGVDTLAVAVGNIHGIVKLKRSATMKLNLPRLQAIHDAIPDVPLVLHGASGLHASELKSAIDLGIVVVNMNTELKLAFVGSIRTTLAADKDLFDPRELFKPAMQAIEQVVSEKFDALGSSEKA